MSAKGDLALRRVERDLRVLRDSSILGFTNSIASMPQMVIKTEYKNIKPYATKDGSLIRELMHPEVHSNRAQSLAEATVLVGSTTLLHKHYKSEEIYHITAGTGLMTVGGEKLEVTVGDTIHIPPGTPHQIQNTGTSSLRLLCCCSPPYAHRDTTVLMGDGGNREV